VRCGKTNSPERGIFFKQIQKVVLASKLGFPKSHPSLMVIPLNHGLKSHVTKRRGIAHGHLAHADELKRS
jgi:hypothetical protein